jgi:hypothetical protein
MKISDLTIYGKLNYEEQRDRRSMLRFRDLPVAGRTGANPPPPGILLFLLMLCDVPLAIKVVQEIR